MAKTLRIRNRAGWVTKPLTDIPANRLTPAEVDDNFLEIVDDYADQTDPLKGAGLVGRSIASLQDYAALRALTSACKSDTVYITGNLVTKKPVGISGIFQLDTTDTTTADDGGTVLVDASGRRWKREHSSEIDVQWFGATGMGVEDDSDALQRAFDYIKNNQFPINGEQWMYIKASMFFPEGTYNISRQIVVRGLVSIRGVGTGYVAGSTIHQTAANTNIFTIFSSGTEISGMNFEFEDVGGSGYGYALAYLAFDGVTPIISNSHYIHHNRCGGFHNKGRFLLLEKCNDVDVSYNTVDVVNPGQAMVVGSQDRDLECSDIRITGNNFFACEEAIVIYKATSVHINNNTFSNQYAAGAAIRLVSDTAPIAGSITGITILGNTFWRQYNALRFDGSATDVTYSNNKHRGCLAEPIVALGALNYYGYKFHNNTFHLSVAGSEPYPYTYSYAHCPFSFGSARMFNSEICDTKVYSNGLNAVTKLFASATIAYCFGGGMVFRNNKIIDNTSIEGAYKSFVPMTSDELVIKAERTFTNYPTSEPLLNFNSEGIAVSDFGTFYLDYEVVCNKPGTAAGVRIGTAKVSFAYLTSLKYVVTDISNITDDIGGAYAIPTVSFTMTTSPTYSGLLVTVTGGLSATFTTTVKAKAYWSTSSGTTQVRTS